MRCEVCGKEILGPPQRRVIEGAKLTVCSRCAPFGSSEWGVSRPAPVKTTSSGRVSMMPTLAPRPRIRNDVESVESLELIEDYGAQIRKARQKLGLSEKDLAKKMQEKESVVKNLEKQDLTPDQRLIAKIKKYLSLDIVERLDASKGSILARPTGAKTIGDMLKMKAEGEEKP
jgi:putative transcription factor